jgi:ATP-dependent DNA helicase RecG
LEADVDINEVQSAVADASKVRRSFFRDADQTLMVLEDFSAAKYGRLTNGGDVLFARNPAVRLPQIRIRAMCYSSDKAGETFSDMKSFEGPLHRIFEEAYTFIVRNTPSVSRFIKGNPKRQDAPLYPEEAVREALINALAHRDYSAASGGVSIHVFPRRLEIWNSGPLPDGVTEENLPKGHISVLRNPDIAHVLYLRGLMEKAGRGSVLMIQQCRDAGLPAPFWKSDPKLGVTVTFPAPELATQATPQPGSSRDQVGTKSGPSRDQAEILRKCLTESAIRDLMELVDRSNRSKFRDQVLKPMLEANWVEMTIPDKPTSSNQRYRTTATGKALLERQS